MQSHYHCKLARAGDNISAVLFLVIFKVGFRSFLSLNIGISALFALYTQVQASMFLAIAEPLSFSKEPPLAKGAKAFCSEGLSRYHQ